MKNNKLNTDSNKKHVTYKIKENHPQKEIMRKIDDEINCQCPKDVSKDRFINDKIKIAPSTYYKYLNCSSKLSLAQLQTMVSFLELSYDDLFNNVSQRTETKTLKDKFADIVREEGKHNRIMSNMISELLVKNYEEITKILGFMNNQNVRARPSETTINPL